MRGGGGITARNKKENERGTEESNKRGWGLKESFLQESGKRGNRENV